MKIMAQAEISRSQLTRQPKSTPSHPVQPFFRFGDLPPEIRSMVYDLATGNLQFPDEIFERSTTWNGVVLPAISQGAKALSQVSRAVRNESLSTYYADSTYELDYSCKPGGLDNIEMWASTWGILAIPHIRSIRVICPFSFLYREKICVRTKGPGPLVSFGGPYNWSAELASDLNDLAMAILQPRGNIELTAETLKLLLVALQLFRYSWDAGPPRESWERLLKQLTSKAGQEEVIPDGE